MEDVLETALRQRVLHKLETQEVWVHKGDGVFPMRHLDDFEGPEYSHDMVDGESCMVVEFDVTSAEGTGGKFGVVGTDTWRMGLVGRKGIHFVFEEEDSRVILDEMKSGDKSPILRLHGPDGHKDGYGTVEGPSREIDLFKGQVGGEIDHKEVVDNMDERVLEIIDDW